MGLPLGIEYERKKQRLQQELRMDYRHYMAQVTLRHDLLTHVFVCCVSHIMSLGWFYLKKKKKALKYVDCTEGYVVIFL